MSAPKEKRPSGQAEVQVERLFRERHPTPAAGLVNFGSDITLPPEVREELSRRGVAPGQHAPKPKLRGFPPWAKSVRAFTRQVLTPILSIAIIVMVVMVVVMIAMTTRSDRSTPQAAHGAPALSGVSARTPATNLAPIGATQPTSAGVSVPPPDTSTRLYREWVPGSEGGWVLTDAQCVPIRGSFLADPAPRALPAVPRAELVRW
jgi:hypothetical protein